MAYIYDLADTWNASGTTFTAIKMNVTDTASAAASLLMDLQVGGVSRFSVAKGGNVTIAGDLFATTALSMDFSLSGLPVAGIGLQYFGLNQSASFRWTGSSTDPTTTATLALFQDAANTLGQRNGVNAQTFNLYNTYTDASNYERARLAWVGNELRFGPESLGTGSARSLGIYQGNIRYQIIGSNFNQFDQPIYINTTGIATGAGAAGFKIGTATTQGLGFWNATPSAQPTAVANATDATSVITQLNALLSRMRTIGLIAT